MSEAEARPSNFIRQIIDEDLATGKHTTVHTRFPPEPNGYLHIGHAKSICLNFGIAQDYQGQCNLRFDDTNPVKEDIEYVESIKNDVQWLGFNWSGDICYSSDYFDQLYAYAVELINKGLAYVDELSADEIREYRGSLTAPGKNRPAASGASTRCTTLPTASAMRWKALLTPCVRWSSRTTVVCTIGCWITSLFRCIRVSTSSLV